MTREELDAYLAQKEQEKGLRPGEFRALWQQESGGSIDPNLKGVYLPKHGTAASGPFQVMPNMHPQFPVGGPLKDQADYAVQFYAGGGGTPEQRMRRYYGTGVAPKGFPTTDQYVAQTMGRMGQQQPLQHTQQQEQEMATPNYQGSPYEPQYMQVPEPSNYDDLPQTRGPAGAYRRAEVAGGSADRRWARQSWLLPDLLWAPRLGMGWRVPPRVWARRRRPRTTCTNCK